MAPVPLRRPLRRRPAPTTTPHSDGGADERAGDPARARAVAFDSVTSLGDALVGVDYMARDTVDLDGYCESGVVPVYDAV